MATLASKRRNCGKVADLTNSREILEPNWLLMSAGDTGTPNRPDVVLLRVYYDSSTNKTLIRIVNCELFGMFVETNLYTLNQIVRLHFYRTHKNNL